MAINKFICGLCAVSLSVIMGLCACTTYIEETDRRITTNLEELEMNLIRSKIPDVPEIVDTVRTKNDIWLGSQSVKIMEGDPLPPELEQEDSITLVVSGSTTLADIARQITDITKIPVRLDDLKASDSVPEEEISLNYTGSLSGLLNYLANRYSIWWRHKGGQITLLAKETRVFTIYALPTETSISASLQGASLGTEGGTGNGNANTSLSTSADLALWDSIEEGVKQVVGEDGTLSFSRVTGMITVTASPYIIARVGSYIAGWNERLSRQVAISIKVLQVTVNNADNYGIDLKAVFENNTITGGAASPYFIDTGSPLSSSGAGLFSMALIDSESKWNSSSAVVEAFSSLGKTSIVTTSTVTTLNNKVAPIQVSTTQNYVKSTEITSSGTGIDREYDISLNTDTLSYGFTMEILPRILDHGRLIVLFTLTLSDLLALDAFQVAGLSDEETYTEETTSASEQLGNAITAVQLPKMEIRGFIQEIAMRSGATLVLTGFERVQDSLNSAGIGRPKISILGGQAQNTNTRDVLVLLVTPEVLESPLSPETRMRHF